VLVSAFDTNDPVALDRLEDLLEAYREARLAAPGSVLARIRANVLAQAAAASATTAAANRLRLVEPPSSRTRGWLPPRFARAALGFGFAAALTLGTSAAVFAAPPGSPFYNARVFIESAFLPTQLDARLVAHEDLLAERLHEAEPAAARGDIDALAAALAAYQAEVDDAAADVGDDPTRLAHLEDVLANHTAVLTALAATLPEQSSIDNAIENSSKAITKLQDKSHPAHPSHPPQGGGGSGGGNGGDGGGGGQGEN